MRSNQLVELSLTSDPCNYLKNLRMLKILSNIDFCWRELVSSISPWTGIVANYAYFDSSRESVPCRNHNGSKIPFLRWENRPRSLGCFLESSHPSSSRVIGCWGPFLSLPDGPMDADDDTIMILWKVSAFVSSTGKYTAALSGNLIKPMRRQLMQMQGWLTLIIWSFFLLFSYWSPM